MAKKSVKELVQSPKDKKMAAIQAACAALQAKFGKESVNFLGNNKIEPIPRIPTGSIALDRITGGGYPLGRIIEVFGPSSSGKTTFCYHAIAEAQKMFPDDWCGFVDSEHTFDPEYASNIGVNVAELMTAQPDSGTDAFAMVQGMIEAGAKLLVVDSVAAMVPREEMEEEDYGKNSIGLQARMMSKGLRKLASIAGKYKCVIIFTNQTRNKIGVMYGNPEVTTGGKALEYYASIRLRIAQSGKIEETVDGEKVVKAIESKITTVKNKCYAPYKSCVNVIEFGKGVDNDAGILDLAIAAGFIVKKGGWYSINGSNVAQGLVNLKVYLENNPELYADIKKKVKEHSDNEIKKAGIVNESIEADGMTDDEIANNITESDDTEAGEI